MKPGTKRWKTKMLFFSQFDLQLTGGTKCTETFQKNSQMFITSHRLPQRLVACCVGISEIVLFKPKKMFDFTMNSFLDALFITRRPPWATPHSAQHWVSSQYLLSEQRVHGFVHLHHYHLQDLQRITKPFIQTKPPWRVQTQGEPAMIGGHNCKGFLLGWVLLTRLHDSKPRINSVWVW